MTPAERREMHRKIIDLLSFIGWHDAEHVMGGVTAETAFNNACDLLDLPAGKMMNVIRGEALPEPEVDG